MELGTILQNRGNAFKRNVLIIASVGTLIWVTGADLAELRFFNVSLPADQPAAVAWLVLASVLIYQMVMLGLHAWGDWFAWRVAYDKDTENEFPFKYIFFDPKIGETIVGGQPIFYVEYLPTEVRILSTSQVNFETAFKNPETFSGRKISRRITKSRRRVVRLHVCVFRAAEVGFPIAWGGVIFVKSVSEALALLFPPLPVLPIF
jgi:hypothetical protein